MSDLEFTVDDDAVYGDLPTFEWRKYQRGFMGILNNAYNQSCNAGGKTLGNMSEITSEFGGGSYNEFIEFYRSEYDGEARAKRAVEQMSDNLVARVESVGGSLERSKAKKWATRYINSMLVNSYRGFMDEARAIEIVAERLGDEWRVADPSEESAGVDGYIGNHSVQVKPTTYNNLDVNSFVADMLITYEYSDGEFTVRCRTT